MRAQVVKTSTPKRLLDWLSRREVDSHLIAVTKRVSYVKVVARDGQLVRFPRRLVRPCSLEEIALNCPQWFGHDGSCGWHPLLPGNVV